MTEYSEHGGVRDARRVPLPQELLQAI
jgi:hypothetical protein